MWLNVSRFISIVYYEQIIDEDSIIAKVKNKLSKSTEKAEDA